MEIIKKISVGGINNVRKGFKDGSTVAKLRARIVGIVRSAKWDETEFGMAAKFIGDFRAWNQDGGAFAGPVLFLPEPAQTMLADVLKIDGGGNGVEFAFDLFTAPNAESVTGYVWNVTPLFEAVVSDPMAVLMARIGAPVIEKPEPEPMPQPGLDLGEAGKGGESQPGDAPLGSEGNEPAPATTSRKKK